MNPRFRQWDFGCEARRKEWGGWGCTTVLLHSHYDAATTHRAKVTCLKKKPPSLPLRTAAIYFLLNTPMLAL